MIDVVIRVKNKTLFMSHFGHQILEITPHASRREETFAYGDNGIMKSNGTGGNFTFRTITSRQRQFRH